MKIVIYLTLKGTGVNRLIALVTTFHWSPKHSGFFIVIELDFNFNLYSYSQC